MKILAALTFYHPHWTGLTAYARRIAEGLAARGHQVTVLTSQYAPELAREEWVGGVRVLRLPFVARLSRTVIMPGFAAAAARLIAEHDLVHIHAPMPELLLLVALARALGKPALVTHQGDVVMPAGGFNQAIERVMHASSALGMRLASGVATHSADYARHSALLAPLAGRVVAITPPVTLPAPDLAASAAWKRALGLEGRRLVGFAGRFVEEKGFDLLLRAVPLVREQIAEAHFVYAGETDVVYERFFARWRHLFEQHRGAITSLGLLRDPQRMADFYAMCDVFALPSRSDCFPSVLPESLLAGTPLVVADIPGARELVLRSGMGRLVAARDHRALAAGIVAQLNDPARPDPARARALLDPSRALDAYEALMLRLAQPPGAGARPAPAQPSDLPARQPGASQPANDRATLERLLRNEADMAFRRRALALIEHLGLRDGERVLDCGCGMGVYLMLMSRLRQLELVGADGDAGRLAWAEREGVAARLARADLHRLPFASGSFDKVLMSEVLEHLADDRLAMREVLRVLRPGGTLALSVPHARYPLAWDPINKALEALGLRPIRSAGPITGLWSNHWRLYTPAQLRDVVGGAGFVIEALEEQTHYAFPFIHLLVYSIGKPLIEHNLLPRRLRDSADRFRGEHNPGGLLNPVNLGVRLLRWFDRRNDYLRGDERTFVNLVMKARRPDTTSG